MNRDDVQRADVRAPAPRRASRPWPYLLAVVLLLPVIVFAVGLGAGFNSAHIEDGGQASLLPFAPAAFFAVLLAVVAGFGLRAMRLQTAERRWSGPQTFVGVMVASVALGMVLGVFNALVEGAWIAVAVRSAAGGVACFLSLIYWRRIDEAAREAQKSAWFWGGGAGVALCAVVQPLTRTDTGVPTLPALVGDGSSHDWLVSGALYLLAAQGAFALLFWSAWWIRAR